MATPDEPSDFELLRRFLVSRERRFGIVTATASDLATLMATRQQAADAVVAAGASLATLDVQPGSSILDQMVEAAKNADVLFVDRLDRVLFDPLGATTVTSEIESLNWDRDRLPHELQARTVIWLLPSGARALAVVARDLSDIVMSRYTFRAAVPGAIEVGPLDIEGTHPPPEPDNRRRIHLLDAVLARLPVDSLPWARTALELAVERARLKEDSFETPMLRSVAAILDREGELGLSARAYSLIADEAATSDEASTIVDRDVVPRAKASGDRRALVAANLHRAKVQFAQAHSSAGRAILENDVIPQLEELGAEVQVALLRSQLARFDVSDGHPELAVTSLTQRIVPTLEKAQSHSAAGDALLTLASALRMLDRNDEAATACRSAIQHYEQAADLAGQARAYERLATILRRRGDVELARQMWRDHVIPLRARADESA